jgi:peptidoglycan-N-acetylglucosamine deacetylase
MHTINLDRRKATQRNHTPRVFSPGKWISAKWIHNQLSSGNRQFSPADGCGFIALTVYLPLWVINPHLTLIPLSLFIMACAVAPLFPTLSFFMPIIYKGGVPGLAVSLAFDDGPDPVSTPPLLGMLKKHDMKATFFVTGKRCRQHPELIREILSHGHTIGNHSYTHDNLLMFRSVEVITEEILETQRALKTLGIMPKLFRPPVGITTPRIAEAVLRTGLITVTFSNRAGDMGNRNVRNLSSRILRRLKSNDIILLHDIAPPRKPDLHYWMRETEKILRGIKANGFNVLPLEELLGQAVMEIEPSQKYMGKINLAHALRSDTEF